jgi:hypothetical protein
MEDLKEVSRVGKRIIYWFIGLIIVFSVVGLVVRSIKKATHIEEAVIIYEEYQEIYNTCSKLNTDLCNMESLPEDDKMFEQFSKAQRILAIKTNLNRWVEEYNSKSKMWGRQLWKSNELPYQLNVNQFNCNN